MRQMKICTCGNHCCHERQKFEIIHSENESGYTFMFERWTCAECDAWIGDKLIKRAS